MESGGPYRNGVDSHYFATLGARIIRGRGFTDADGEAGQRVVVINETMARRIWPNADPIGSCVSVAADSLPCATVVGVVEDIARFQLREGASYQYYVPIAQWSGPHARAMLIRSRDDKTSAMAVAVRKAIQGIASDIPFPQVVTYEQVVDPMLRSWRLGATMFTVFGVLAFLVAVIGQYGLLSHSVAQRQFEFGIRAALGARSTDILRMVVVGGLKVAGAGLVIGLSLALAASKWAGPLLFDVSPHDLPIYSATAVGVLVIAVVAAIVPAARAAKVPPVEALRAE